MTVVAAPKRRIVQVAKDLNISHRDIMEFLDSRGIKVTSHMSPLGEEGYQLIIEEFEKDLQTVERYRKEKTRKQIHSRMIEEKMNEGSSLEILMPDEADKLDDIVIEKPIEPTITELLETEPKQEDGKEEAVSVDGELEELTAETEEIDEPIRKSLWLSLILIRRRQSQSSAKWICLRYSLRLRVHVDVLQRQLRMMRKKKKKIFLSRPLSSGL